MAKRPGPASSLTVKLADELCEQLKRGHYQHAACAAVGIHRATLHKWLQRGARARSRREEGLAVPRVDLPYLHLLEKVEFAVDYGGWWLAEQALNAAENPRDARWQAYVTILERSRPNEWRRRASAEFIDDAKKPARDRIDVSKLTTAERASLRELLQKAAGDGS